MFKTKMDNVRTIYKFKKIRKYHFYVIINKKYEIIFSTCIFPKILVKARYFHTLKGARFWHHFNKNISFIFLILVYLFFYYRINEFVHRNSPTALFASKFYILIFLCDIYSFYNMIFFTL